MAIPLNRVSSRGLIFGKKVVTFEMVSPQGRFSSKNWHSWIHLLFLGRANPSKQVFVQVQVFVIWKSPLIF